MQIRCLAVHSKKALDFSVLMIHSNIHFIYKSSAQRCGRNDVEENGIQLKKQ